MGSALRVPSEGDFIAARAWCQFLCLAHGYSNCHGLPLMTGEAEVMSTLRACWGLR